MLKESLTVVSVVSVAEPAISEVIATLNRGTKGQHRNLVEYVHLHPALTEQTKIVDQARFAADHENHYLAIFSSGEAQFSDVLSALRETNKSCVARGTHHLSWQGISSFTEITEETRLMDNRVVLKLGVGPENKGEGWAFSFAGTVPLQALPVLHEALVACCALGRDGCSPLVDVAVRVLSMELASSDAFVFRQRASLYRAVRRAFLKALA